MLTKKQITHKNRPYTFSHYDSNWVKIFEENAKVIEKIFGDQIILLEHVGSTSILGMWAKPQIDILVTVKDFFKVRDFYGEMGKQGYTFRGDYTNEGEEYFTKDTREGNREVSIHVLPDGHPWSIDLLDFRDYLREHSKEMKFYSDIKRSMNEKYPIDYSNYYKGKLKAVHILRKKAASWRGHELK